MQWCSVGSGIEHAEGGGSQKGERMEGFQLWLNVPRERKMDDPRYGTIGPDQLPVLRFGGGVSARLLAGALGGETGPFKTVAPLLMFDASVPAGETFLLAVPPEFDTAMAYVWRGAARVNGAGASKHQIALLDARGADARGLEIAAAAGAAEAASVMVFIGKKLKQPMHVRQRNPTIRTSPTHSP